MGYLAAWCFTLTGLYIPKTEVGIRTTGENGGVWAGVEINYRKVIWRVLLIWLADEMIYQTSDSI